MTPMDRLKPYPTDDRMPISKRYDMLNPTVDAPMRPPAPLPVMYAQQQPQGPQQPLQWQNIGADQQQGQQDAGAVGGGLQALLARFKKPAAGGFTPEQAEGFAGAA